MNNKHKEEQLFEALKKLPPEISEAKVQKIIQGLPLLPVPKTHWIHQLNLNSIIMSSSIITLIVGATLILTNADRSEEMATYIAPLEEIIPEVVEETKNVEAIVNVTEVEPKISEEEVIKKQLPITPLPQQDVPSPLATNYDLPELLPMPKVVQSQPIDTFISTENITEEEQEWSSINLNLDRCKGTPKISDTGIKLLKINLLNKLKGDQIIVSKKNKMVITFNKNGVLVNNQLLANHLQNKYLDFLQKNNITPCDNRLVITTSEYIAVGNHTKEGFKGHIDGRVNLEELELYQGYGTTLFPQKEERQIESFHSLKIGGLAVVYLSNTPSKTAKLKVTGMPIKDVTTKVVDGVLIIDTKGQHSGEKINIEIGATNLKSIEVGGSAELRSEDQLESEQMSIFVVDTGSAWLDVDINDLKINLLGGDLFIKGEAKKQEVSVGKDYERGTLENNLFNQ